MAKFVPSQYVEKLEYDFTDYGGSEGVIPEPSTGRVNQFFKHMKNMAKDVNQLRGAADEIGDDEIENMSDEAMIERLKKVEEVEVAGSEFQQRTIQNLAFLCGGEFIETLDDDNNVIEIRVDGGSPSTVEFDKLPFRVLQAFSTWLMGEIRPKATTRATKR